MNELRVNISIGTEDARGTALFVPGMNNSDDSMVAWERCLVRIGYQPVRVRLSGHGADPHGASAERWIEEWVATHRAVASQAPDRPLIAIGYSAGALVTVAALDRNPQLSLDAAIFLAPAIRLRPISELARAVRALRPWRGRVPSFVPRRFRAHAWTSADSYAALFELVDRVRELDHPDRLRALPCTSLFGQSDPLVSLDRYEAWRARHELRSWRTVRLGTPPATHLLLDEGTVSARAWSVATSEIENVARAALECDGSRPELPQ